MFRRVTRTPPIRDPTRRKNPNRDRRRSARDTSFAACSLSNNPISHEPKSAEAARIM
jgi:hypothetical protein